MVPMVARFGCRRRVLKSRTAPEKRRPGDGKIKSRTSRLWAVVLFQWVMRQFREVRRIAEHRRRDDYSMISVTQGDVRFAIVRWYATADSTDADRRSRRKHCLARALAAALARPFALSTFWTLCQFEVAFAMRSR